MSYLIVGVACFTVGMVIGFLFCCFCLNVGPK